MDAVTQQLVLTGDAAADISRLFFFFSSSSIVFLSLLGQNERRGGRPERLCVKCHGCCNDKVTADFTGKCHRGSVSPTLDSLCEDTRTNQRVSSTCTPPLRPHKNVPVPLSHPSSQRCPQSSKLSQAPLLSSTIIFSRPSIILYVLQSPPKNPRPRGPTAHQRYQN